jgi:hypothetical protein
VPKKRESEMSCNVFEHSEFHFIVCDWSPSLRLMRARERPNL